jgi:hypothetical protein
LQPQISAAERAIAARLKDRHQPDTYEKLALTDALNALQVLIGETTKKQQRQKEEHHTA